MMTRKEAIKQIEKLNSYCEYMADSDESGAYLFDLDGQALDLALSALRHQIWEEKLWRDAKTDPPKTPGLYYGKKDDTNSTYPCLYRDGIWVLDAYPQTKMDIVKWADYTAFVKEDD